MKRLFAFGCSLTYYSWPTWADIIGTGFDEYYNFGVMGMGNQFIHHTIYEADSIFNFTPDDTVLVMFTNPFRYDSFILDPQDNNLRWQSRGFIYQPSNDNLYTDHWREKFWSPEHSYMSTWLAIKSAKQLLDSKNVTYRLLPGISCQNVERTGPIDISNHQFISPYYNQILEMFHVKEPFLEWTNLNFDKSEFYAFADTGVDQHPTIKMHGSYVMQFLPEFCTDDTAKYTELLENDIDLSLQENNWRKPAFSAIRGKKVGSVLNWQYMVTNAVGNEVFSQ